MKSNYSVNTVHLLNFPPRYQCSALVAVIIMPAIILNVLATRHLC